VVFKLQILLPSLAAGDRRPHDTARSGWWRLPFFVALLGWTVLIVFWVQELRPNRCDSATAYA